MSEYTEKQATRIARQIKERFGALIAAACANSIVPTSFLAGFIGVEAGKDRAGNIKPEATRFEPGVFEDLRSLRDNGFCFIGRRKRLTYSGVTREQIKDADDDALRALATSYGLTQIMGWHCINNLQCTVADLRDDQKHLHFAVKLLGIVGGDYLKRRDFPSVLRIWNTGSPSGKTYHDEYVPNALRVMREYGELANSAQEDRQIAARPAAIEQTEKTPILDAMKRKANETLQPVDTAFATARDVSTNISEKAAIVEQVKTTAGTIVDVVGLPGTRQFDTAARVTRGTVFQRVLAGCGIVFGSIGSYLGALLSNWKLIALGVGAVFVIVVIVILVNFVLDYLRLNYRSNPNRYNVE